MTGFIKHTLEIFGIVFFRFNLVPRLWCVWLVAVNAASLVFIQHIEAQVVLATTLLAVLLQTFIYRITGFTRILGIVHLLWLPMFWWFASRIDSIAQHDALSSWLLVLIATNLVSLVIDISDNLRYLRGERQAHYHW